ncbi:hypothetical protein DERP_003407 [Dermatophagoides pteronyssinus]|uniref:Phospholipid scramblase n=1 Tax=Dermatophagoides pteronyssinus TaxID=6956 RepID=A0ABQ8JJV7_DERPT|nr:hypothetical protein DERP_003407 [Dermatophagoides pteronyssinus]
MVNFAFVPVVEPIFVHKKRHILSIHVNRIFGRGCCCCCCCELSISSIANPIGRFEEFELIVSGFLINQSINQSIWQYQNRH